MTIGRTLRTSLPVVALLLSGAAALYCWHFGLPPSRSTTLLSRSTHGDYEKATFSFEHGVRDDADLSLTRNDWDIQFGNGGDRFTVTMVADDRSRITDLGSMPWPAMALRRLPDLPAHPAPAREPPVAVIPGHVYLVHIVDRNTDLYALLRVESLVPGDRVDVSWRLTSPDAQPWWPAVGLQAAIALALAWSVSACVLLAVRGGVGARRRRRGLCPKCGYVPGGSAVCSECGAPVPADAIVDPTLDDLARLRSIVDGTLLPAGFRVDAEASSAGAGDDVVVYERDDLRVRFVWDARHGSGRLHRREADEEHWTPVGPEILEAPAARMQRMAREQWAPALAALAR